MFQKVSPNAKTHKVQFFLLLFMKSVGDKKKPILITDLPYLLNVLKCCALLNLVKMMKSDWWLMTSVCFMCSYSRRQLSWRFTHTPLKNAASCVSDHLWMIRHTECIHTCTGSCEQRKCVNAGVDSLSGSQQLSAVIVTHGLSCISQKKLRHFSLNVRKQWKCSSHRQRVQCDEFESVCSRTSESFLAQDRVKNSSKFHSKEAGTRKCFTFPQENVLNYYH